MRRMSCSWSGVSWSPLEMPIYSLTFADKTAPPSPIPAQRDARTPRVPSIPASMAMSFRPIEKHASNEGASHPRRRSRLSSRRTTRSRSSWQRLRRTEYIPHYDTRPRTLSTSTVGIVGIRSDIPSMIACNASLLRHPAVRKLRVVCGSDVMSGVEKCATEI